MLLGGYSGSVTLTQTENYDGNVWANGANTNQAINSANGGLGEL